MQQKQSQQLAWCAVQGLPPTLSVMWKWVWSWRNQNCQHCYKFLQWCPDTHLECRWLPAAQHWNTGVTEAQAQKYCTYSTKATNTFRQSCAEPEYNNKPMYMWMGHRTTPHNHRYTNYKIPHIANKCNVHPDSGAIICQCHPCVEWVLHLPLSHFSLHPKSTPFQLHSQALGVCCLAGQPGLCMHARVLAQTPQSQVCCQVFATIVRTCWVDP